MQMTINSIRDVLTYIAEHQHFNEKNHSYQFEAISEFAILEGLKPQIDATLYTEQDVVYTIMCLIDGGYLLSPADTAKDYMHLVKHTVYCFSYQGDEFYKSIVNPSVWQKIQSAFSDKITPSLSLILQIAQTVAAAI